MAKTRVSISVIGQKSYVICSEMSREFVPSARRRERKHPRLWVGLAAMVKQEGSPADHRADSVDMATAHLSADSVAVCTVTAEDLMALARTSMLLAKVEMTVTTMTTKSTMNSMRAPPPSQDEAIQSADESPNQHDTRLHLPRHEQKSS